MTKEIDLNNITQQLTIWYRTEVQSLATAAIEACVGRLVTALPPEDLADVPAYYRASAVASFVPYRIMSGHQERIPGEDREEYLREWVDQTTDGHEFVIYTHKARLVLVATDNPDAYSELGSETQTPETMACCALRADVWELLEARRDEWEGEDE